MGMIRWMSAAGDTQVAWDETDTASMERAQEMIEGAYREGRGVFAVDEDGVGTRMNAFDPSAKNIVVTPPICGG